MQLIRIDQKSFAQALELFIEKPLVAAIYLIDGNISWLSRRYHKVFTEHCLARRIHILRKKNGETTAVIQAVDHLCEVGNERRSHHEKDAANRNWRAALTRSDARLAEDLCRHVFLLKDTCQL